MRLAYVQFVFEVMVSRSSTDQFGNKKKLFTNTLQAMYEKRLTRFAMATRKKEICQLVSFRSSFVVRV